MRGVELSNIDAFVDVNITGADYATHPTSGLVAGTNAQDGGGGMSRYSPGQR